MVGRATAVTVPPVTADEQARYVSACVAQEAGAGGTAEIGKVRGKSVMYVKSMPCLIEMDQTVIYISTP